MNNVRLFWGWRNGKLVPKRRELEALQALDFTSLIEIEQEIDRNAKLARIKKLKIELETLEKEVNNESEQ
jgi:hypothetical protein